MLILWPVCTLMDYQARQSYTNDSQFCGRKADHYLLHYMQFIYQILLWSQIVFFISDSYQDLCVSPYSTLTIMKHFILLLFTRLKTHLHLFKPRKLNFLLKTSLSSILRILMFFLH